jgi:hypothetical protein
MFSPCLHSQCSRRALLDAASTNKKLLNQSRKLKTGRQSHPEQRMSNVNIKRMDSWPWHRNSSKMDMQNTPRAAFISLLSFDKREDTTKRTHSRFASNMTNPSSFLMRQPNAYSYFLAAFLHRSPQHNPEATQRRHFKSATRNLKEDQSASSSYSTQPNQQEEILPPKQSPSKTSPKPRPLPLLRDIHVPQFGVDADKAVRSLQNARKERARAKTAANVRRALYGNLIICASKLGAWISSGSSSMMSEFVYVHHRIRC